MKNMMVIALGMLAFTGVSTAQTSGWTRDSSQTQTRLFDLVAIGYQSRGASRAYDNDIYGRIPPHLGGIRFDFAAKSISITGLDLPLPIDVDATALAGLKRACEELVAACESGRPPTVDTITLGAVTCGLTYTIPNSLQSSASLLVHHASGERFSISKVGFVAFALEKLGAIRQEVLGGFDDAAQRFKVEGSVVIAAAVKSKYGAREVIDASLKGFDEIRPIVGDIFEQDRARAITEANALVEREAARHITVYCEGLDHRRKNYSGKTAEFVLATIGSEGARLISSPSFSNPRSCEDLLPHDPTVTGAIRQLGVNANARLLAAALNVATKRFGLSFEQIVAEEAALARKLASLSEGTTVYTPEEELKGKILREMSIAIVERRIDGDDHDIKRKMERLTFEVVKSGKFIPNPDYFAAKKAHDAFRQSVRATLGVDVENLATFIRVMQQVGIK